MHRTVNERYGRALRRLAGTVSLAMAWLTIGPSVGIAYAASHQPRPRGHQRTLNAVELAAMTGAQMMTVTGTGTTPTPFRFVGQGGYQGDADTGLMLCGHRYYDSSTGRFLSRDPAWAGENWFAYGGADPVNSRDSNGLQSTLQTKAGAQELAAGAADMGDCSPTPGYVPPPSTVTAPPPHPITIWTWIGTTVVTIGVFIGLKTVQNPPTRPAPTPSTPPPTPAPTKAQVKAILKYMKEAPIPPTLKY